MVDFRACSHRLPWNFAGFHGKCHGSWHFHSNCHGGGDGTCRGSFRRKLGRINKGNPRKSVAIAKAVSGKFAWPSAVIATAPRQSPRKSAEVRGNYHGSFRGHPTEAISTAIRCRPRPWPRQFPDTRRLLRKSGAIATARAPVLCVANSVVSTMPTEVRGNGHGSFRGVCVQKSVKTPQ